MNRDQLPHVMYLIDDDSSEVRDEILKGLSEYGFSLEEDLKEFHNILLPDKIKLIEPILMENRRKWLKKNWIEWQKLNNDFDRIECASELIAKFQFGIAYNYNLSERLDYISQNFQNFYPYGNELDLSFHLFRQLKFNGEKDDYYNPLNSNLIYVIENRKGLPITLCILFMLIGNRLGFDIRGCNFPGHFLAKINFDEEIVLIDCFNEGKILYQSDVYDLLKDSFAELNNIIYKDISAKLIIRRVVGNLITAYKEIGDQQNRSLFSELLESTPWK